MLALVAAGFCLAAPVQGHAQSATFVFRAPALAGGAQASNPSQLVDFVETSANFGYVDVGSTASVTAVLRNGSKSSIELSEFEVGGEGFSISSSTCGATLAANDSCATEILFSPQAAYGASGGVRVFTSVGTRMVLFKGVGAGGDVYAFPYELAFSQLQVGQTFVRTIELQNSGTGSVSGLQLALEGSPDFSTTHRCSTLASEESCEVEVEYRPLTAGAHQAQLTISATKGWEGPLTVPLQGSAVAPIVTLGIDSFGSMPSGVLRVSRARLSNDGVAPVRITPPSAQSVTGEGFAFYGTTCGTSLGAGAFCTIDVSLMPEGTQTYAGTLTVETEAGPQTVGLTGTSF